MARFRILAVLAALPLLAVDCGGKTEPAAGNPFGFDCKLHVSGPGVSEDMWCIVAAYDYANPPPGGIALEQWGLNLTAYRDLQTVGAGVGVFLNGPPTLGAGYGWDGDVATSGLDGGSADRYTGTGAATTLTHEAASLPGTGRLTVRFTQIPPPGTMQQATLVHGSLTGTIEPVAVGTTLTLRATF